MERTSFNIGMKKPTRRALFPTLFWGVLVTSFLVTSGAAAPACADNEASAVADREAAASDAVRPGRDDPQRGDEEIGIRDDELLGDDELLVGDELLDGSLLGDEDLLPEDWREEEPESPVPSASHVAHEQLFFEERYPSANTCATCHPKQYREWSVSQHAYAQLSPLMMAMQNVVNVSTSTTAGDFCLRCHAPIGSELGEPFSMSNLDRHPASREGITCVTCHRVSRAWGKVTGRMAFERGDIFSPVYGPTGSGELERVLANRDTYRVVTSRDQLGRAIHTDAKRFFALTTPGFCATCHEVFNVNGLRIEEAFSEYKHSPAAKAGVSCGDCHMGSVQGRKSDFEWGPAAVVGGVPTAERRLSSHLFAGPDSPIVHPGIFPHNPRAAQFKTLEEWLQFDVEAGWGTDEYEDGLTDDSHFPNAWRSIDDRYDARQIIDEQLELLAWARERRIEVMQNGFELGEIEVTRASSTELQFEIEVRSGTDGHLVPTGFDAERLVFLEVTVRDPEGRVVYRSGDRDPNGDLRDTHSLYVMHGAAPLDDDLFNLQSKNITRLVRGGEREQVLPVNTSVSALPFIRPETRPSILYGRPKGARKHRQGIEPGGSRTPRYTVRADRLSGPGPYHVSVKLRYQAVPVNLVAAIQSVGFDYGMSPREVAKAVVAGGEVIWEKELLVHLEDGS